MSTFVSSETPTRERELCVTPGTSHAVKIVLLIISDASTSRLPRCPRMSAQPGTAGYEWRD